MSQSRWRDIARSVIADVIRDHPNASHDELKAAIDQSYPFGSREMHPYKMWLKERAAAFQMLGIPTKQKPTAAAQNQLTAWLNGEPIKG